MKLEVTTAVEPKAELTLTPSQRAGLLINLRMYKTLKADLKDLEAAIDEQRKVLAGKLAALGESSLALDGYKLTEITPTTSKLDPMKLVELGVTTAQIEQATVTKPGRPYLKITVPEA